MSKQTINIGASPNDGTGTPLRTSFDYTNQNFTELYTALGGGVGLPGATTQVIFNDGGTNLAGDAGLVYNKTTDALTVAGLVTAGSATISGDLTVRTNTISATSSGVGFGITTAAAAIDVVTSFQWRSNTAGTDKFAIFSGGAGIIYAGSTTASALAFLYNGAEAMRLNSTGLGIGGSPSAKIHLFDSTPQISLTDTSNSNYRYSIQNAFSALRIFNNTTSTEVCRFDASGNVGIGVTPNTWSASYKFLMLPNGGSLFNDTSNGIYLGANYYALAGSKKIASGYALNYLLDATAGAYKWFTSTAGAGTAGDAVSLTQAMTLDASGNLLVGTTSALASGSTFQNLGASRQVLTLKGDDFGSYTAGVWNASTTNDGLFVYFGTETSLTVRGGISYNRGGGLVAYNTTSDYRAKDIIGPVSNSGSLIDSLKVYVGKMKGATIERPMLIAHEAQEVAPYAVTGTKDEVDAEGKPKYQQMDASALVPLLIAEIQSLRTRVQTLEAR